MFQPLIIDDSAIKGCTVPFLLGRIASGFVLLVIQLVMACTPGDLSHLSDRFYPDCELSPNAFYRYQLLHIRPLYGGFMFSMLS